MSIRAHRVIEVKTADYETFSLTHDTKLAAFLASEEFIYDALTPNGNGMVGIPVKTLKRVIKRANNLELSEGVVDAIKKDIAFAESRGDEFVDYSLF